MISEEKYRNGINSKRKRKRGKSWGLKEALIAHAEGPFFVQWYHTGLLGTSNLIESHKSMGGSIWLSNREHEMDGDKKASYCVAAWFSSHYVAIAL